MNQAKTYKEQRKGITKSASLFKTCLTKSLVDLKKNASGRTIKSIESKIYFTGGFTTVLDILVNDSIIYIDAGRRAGAKQPPKGSLVEWIRDQRIIFLNKSTGKPLSITTTEFLIGRKIARDGIKPTNVLQKVLDKVSPKIDKFVNDSTAQDISRESFEVIQNENK